MDDPAFLDIARRHLGVETLQTRHSDRLDFYEVAVVSIEAALKEAYRLGRSDTGVNKPRRK